MADEKPNPLDYAGAEPPAPQSAPPAPSDHEAYERNGWIGLICTLLVCTIVFILWVVLKWR
jgi:hypothetical protein